jgi:ubiquinone/menaquinone biosynthesis C-methylase UbiE
MEFEDESFDLIICNHVLEHIEDDRKALREIYRVLKNNGISILQVPININREKTFEDPKITSISEREKHFGQYDHVREYGIDYKSRIEEVGFIVEMINYTDNLSEDIINKYGLLKNDLIPIAKKIIE